MFFVTFVQFCLPICLLVFHWHRQMVNSKSFQMYDYGFFGNKMNYGQVWLELLAFNIQEVYSAMSYIVSRYMFAFPTGFLFVKILQPFYSFSWIRGARLAPCGRRVRLATSWPLGERSEAFLAAKRPTVSDEVARGHMKSDEGLFWKSREECDKICFPWVQGSTPAWTP